MTLPEALQHPLFTGKEERLNEVDETSKDPYLENIPDTQQAHSAVGQSENPEHVPPDTAVPLENLADVQPEHSGKKQLNILHEVQTEENTRDCNNHVDILGLSYMQWHLLQTCLVMSGLVDFNCQT